jgi:hypothetical protein
MITHTEGPWRAGRGCVVADQPVPEMGGSDAVEYYGGHLVAESIAPQNIPLIAAAPELLVSASDFLEVLTENGLLCECGEADCRTTRLRAAIAKATGAPA